MPIIKVLLLALLIFQARHVTAAEYDFYIDYSECKMTVAALVLSDENLKVAPGDTTVMACKRVSNVVKCDFEFHDKQQKGHKGNHEEYDIFLDSPPLLYFMNKYGSEFITIDTAQHSAAMVTRMVSQKYLGSKVCKGLYITDFEMKALRK